MEMVLQFSFLVFLQFAVPAISLNDEGLALLSFKQALESSSTGYLDNWNSSATTPCSWNGVQCRKEKVISLNLPGKGLLGSLYLDGRKLAALHNVNLRNNHIHGSLPVELLNATALKYLVLEENSFSGPVPPEISNLRRLKRLALGGNSFTGSLPDGFGTNLVMLQGLNLSFNNFSGLIPMDLGNLSSLQGVLDMSHNQFNGPIPASLGNLPRAVYINLAYNNLTGLIPQNGALENAGPTAFLGNPLLCGSPLKVSCPLGPKPIADKPSETSSRSNGKKGKGNGRTPWIVITAVSGTVIGMCLIGLSFSYWFRKNHASRNQNHVTDCTLEERPSIRKEMFCFRTDDLESLSENMEQYTFIPLDQQISFDLEQLLKASAFLLGKSRRGIIYKVVLETGPTVAVRRLENGGSQRLKEFQAEVETVGKIRHPNIVSLLAYCWCINEKLLIYEFIPNGDLGTALHGPPGRLGTTYLKPLSWSVRLIIMKGVAKGLAFLHDFSPKRFVHGNLKPSNILLGKNMEPYICDIGLTRLAYMTEEFEAAQSEQSAAGIPQPSSPYSMTPTTLSMMGYEAPEASKAMKPSQKWDVYSFGVILLEMMSGKSPGMQMGSSEMDLVRWIQLGIEVKPLVDILDPFLAHDLEDTDEIVAVLNIALACVHVNPDKRPSMRNVSDTLEKLALST